MKQSFSNFVLTNGNAAAVAACKALASGKLASDGVLYLVGPPGCGKTHLLRALESSLATPCRVRYLTDERLMHVFIRKVTGGDASEWEDILTANYVLVDDFNSYGGDAYLSFLQATLVKQGVRLVIAMTELEKDSAGPEDVRARLPGKTIELLTPSEAEIIDIARAHLPSEVPLPPCHKLVTFAVEAQGDTRRMFGAVRSWQFAKQFGDVSGRVELSDHTWATASTARRADYERRPPVPPPKVRHLKTPCSPYACRICGNPKSAHGWFRSRHRFRPFSKNEPCADCSVPLEVHAFADALRYDIHVWEPSDLPLDESHPHFEAAMPRSIAELPAQPSSRSTLRTFEQEWSILREYEAMHHVTSWAKFPDRVLPVEPIVRFGREANATNVLWLDDDERLLKVGCRRLEEKGFRGLGVVHGELARAAVECESFDVVISDFRHNGSDTYLLFKQAMRRPLRLILYTAGVDEPVAEEFRRLGAAVLFKPFDWEELLTALGDLQQ